MEPNNPQLQPKPNNHMVMAIISTVFSLISCTFFGVVPGIVSIVFASQVNGKYQRGEQEAAENSSKYAKFAWIISIVISLALLAYAIYTVVSNPEIIEEFQKEMERQQSLQNQ
mgnify:CR=1 FL=1